MFFFSCNRFVAFMSKWVIRDFAACQSSKALTINHTCHAHLSSFVLRSHLPESRNACSRNVPLGYGEVWSVCCEESQKTKLNTWIHFSPSFIRFFFLPLGQIYSVSWSWGPVHEKYPKWGAGEIWRAIGRMTKKIFVFFLNFVFLFTFYWILCFPYFTVACWSIFSCLHLQTILKNLQQIDTLNHTGKF